MSNWSCTNLIDSSSAVAVFINKSTGKSVAASLGFKMNLGEVTEKFWMVEGERVEYDSVEYSN